MPSAPPLFGPCPSRTVLNDAGGSNNSARLLRCLYPYRVLTPETCFSARIAASFVPVRGTGMNHTAARQARVTRTQAAKMLSTTYQNVRRLQRVGQLHSTPDRHGVHRFDRREVEALAKRRGLQIKPSGELAAKVFAMFKAK